jgi:hypothetical protein
MVLLSEVPIRSRTKTAWSVEPKQEYMIHVIYSKLFSMAEHLDGI